MSRLNDVLGWFVVAVVILSPIPLASNPPFFWGLSGTVVGLAAIVYFIRVLRGRYSLRFPLGNIGVVALLFGLLCIYLIVQMLPLGLLFGPFTFVSGAGDAIASYTLSLAPGATWLMLIRMVSYGLMFMLAAQVAANERRAEKLVTVIFWAIVAHGAFGLIQLTQLNDTLLGFDKTAYQGMATGTFINRNSYATFLAMGLAVGVALIADVAIQVSAGRRLSADALPIILAIVGGLIVLLIAIAASQSRMGLFVAIAGAVVVAMLSIRWIEWRSVLVPVGGTLLVALLFVMVLWLRGQDLLERVVMLDQSGSGRTDIYAQVIEMIKTRPLTGFGGGAFEIAFPVFQGPPLRPEFLVDKAHSTYLALVAELGLVAGSLPIIIGAVLFGGIVRRYFRSDAGSGVRLAAIGAVVAAASHTAVDFSLEMQANAYLFVVLLAFGRAVGGRVAKP